MIFRLLLFLSMVLILELYVFQAVKTFTKVKWVLWSYIVISVGAILFIGYQFSKFDRSVGQTPMTMITLGLLFLVVLNPANLLVPNGRSSLRRGEAKPFPILIPQR